jgi:hypothetical protein
MRLVRAIDRDDGRDRLPDYSETISNAAEKAFLLKAVARKTKNVEIFRAGWPDYLMIEDGKIYGVEVKTRPDNVRPRQAKMFTALERAGISVYVWSPEEPNRLLPWRKWRCGGERGDSKGGVRVRVNRGPR